MVHGCTQKFVHMFSSAPTTPYLTLTPSIFYSLSPPPSITDRQPTNSQSLSSFPLISPQSARFSSLRSSISPHSSPLVLVITKCLNQLERRTKSGVLKSRSLQLQVLSFLLAFELVLLFAFWVCCSMVYTLFFSFWVFCFRSLGRVSIRTGGSTVLKSRDFHRPFLSGKFVRTSRNLNNWRQLHNMNNMQTC